MAESAHKSFNQQFWNEAAGCLFDVVNGESKDASIRPNQIIAVSLTNSMVSKRRAKGLLRVVERELLTPRGLRTLSPHDPQYRGRYEGNPLSRDGAYHQGTVWPWLMGPYITAYVKTLGAGPGQKGPAGRVENFQSHLAEGGARHGTDSLVGAAPDTARGCVAQA